MSAAWVCNVVAALETIRLCPGELVRARGPTNMTDDADLTCRELVEVVTDYLAATMAPEDRLRFEQHLVICSGCATYLEQMRQTIRLVGELREEHIPRGARQELLQAFRRWRLT